MTKLNTDKRKPRQVLILLFCILCELVLTIFFLQIFPYTGVLISLHVAVAVCILQCVLAAECDGIYKAICFILLLFAPIISSLSIVSLLRTVKKQKTPHGNLQYGTFSSFKYFDNGKEFFNDLTEKLCAAKHYVYLEYYIVKNGMIWESIKNTLVLKAREGVRVKLAMDAFGCYGMPKSLKKWLKSHNIEYKSVNPLGVLPNLFFGCRSHKKVAVIDGSVYIGGINLADEYASDPTPHGCWKDAAIRLDGSISRVFLPSGEKLPTIKQQNENLSAEVYSCTPFGRAVLRDVYVQLLSKNKITRFSTPYLSPDYALLQAMKFSIFKGNTVKIYLPDVPDKKTVYALTKIYAEEIALAGGEIYYYKPGFLHSKLCLSGDTAVIGSGNLDYRSFYLQYECGIVTDSCEITDKVKDDFSAIERASERATFPIRNSLVSKLTHSIYKTLLMLIAPLV